VSRFARALRLAPPFCLGLAACGGEPLKVAEGVSRSEPSPSASAGLLPPADTSPGRVTLHRLNRAEYNNTVRDLLGTTLSPADDFPPDDFGHGFDNLAAALSLSPLHIESYEHAAGELMDWSLGTGLLPAEDRLVLANSDDTEATVGGGSGDNWILWSNGNLTTTFDVDVEGTYAFSAKVYATQAGPDLARVTFLVDGDELYEADVAGDSSSPEVHSIELPLDLGEHTLGVRFANDYYDPPNDRNLYVSWLALEGPLDVLAAPAGDPTRVLPCGLDAEPSAACIEDMVRTFGQRAWRRPLADDEVGRLLDLHAFALDAGAHWHEAVSLVGRAMLLSPNFLFRVEADPEPGVEVRPLDDFELASRLSYFLWSSMPDDELLARAAEGQLQDDSVLEAQVRRMLADDKAVALVDNLAGQWLMVRAVDDAFPDPSLFPDFEALRPSIQDQMWLQAADVFLHDRSMLDLLTASDGWADGALAPMLDLDLEPDAPFQRVDLSHTLRRGMLGTPGLQTVLAYPTRTSPVRRGKWVLSNLLCEAPAPPPAGVEAFEDATDTEGLTMREQLELHRQDPTCASCHVLMDPIGLGMEHFDAIGAHRHTDADGAPIDATGTLPSGESFDGLPELAEILAADRKLPACIVDKTFTYALGRAPTVEDLPHLDTIEHHFVAGDHRFADLAVAIVRSEPFRMRAEERP
jgi:hypothetical protein